MLRQGEPVELTGTEFDLLLLLAREPGKVFSRDDILNHLRGHEAELYTRAVDIVVSRLRRKLEPLDCIKTLRNAGYALALASGERGAWLSWPSASGAAPGWPRRAHRRLRHSLKARLVLSFLLLALGITASFLFGMQSALTAGWRDAARPCSPTMSIAWPRRSARPRASSGRKRWSSGCQSPCASTVRQ